MIQVKFYSSSHQSHRREEVRSLAQRAEEKVKGIFGNGLTVFHLSGEYRGKTHRLLFRGEIPTDSLFATVENRN